MKIRKFLENSNKCLFSYEDTIRAAAAVFAEQKTDAGCVVDQSGQFLGVFTRDHLCAAISTGADLDGPLGGHMSRNVKTFHPDEDIADPIGMRCSCFPVVESGRAVGIIGVQDVAKTYHDHYKMTRNIIDAIIQSSRNLIIAAGPDGRINFMNRSAKDVLEANGEMLYGSSIHRLIPEINLPEIIETGKVPPLCKVSINKHPYFIRSYPMWIHDKIIGAVAIFQDTADLESIVDELGAVKELNKDLDAIIESSSDGIFVCDGDANVLRINRAYDEITGLDTSGFYGKNMKKLVKDGFFSQSVTLLVLEKKQARSIIQKTSTGKSLLATGRPVFDEKGRIVRVVTSVRDITELYELQNQLAETQKMTEQYRRELDSYKLRDVKNVDGLVVGSEKMHELVDTAIRLAGVDSTVLITGESGTGKDLVAGIIHTHSLRKNQPFIRVNCSAIPPNLLESELFGYEEGAFTGAKKGGKPGYFEMADGGTLFLDEIGDLPYDFQAKFLRVLQECEFNRVGGAEFRKFDVRIIAATNKDLLEMMHSGNFREDLYYRLSVVPLNIPPLRQRAGEIKFLAASFLKQFNSSYGMEKRFSPDVVDVFERYRWPGNIRELRNLVERVMVMSPDDVISRKDLPASVYGTGPLDGGSQWPGSLSELMPLKQATQGVEKQLLRQAYETLGTTREIARVLGISAPSVVRKAAKYGIKRT